MVDLDEKDYIILNELQGNCRESLTNIAKKVGLSVDSVRKRIMKMENDIFYSKIQIRPRSLGFNNIIDVKIKLRDYSKEEFDKFINYMKEHNRVAELFSISGQWDVSAVIICKGLDDQEKITRDIKDKFGNLISSWTESSTLHAYKFEKYDLVQLMGDDNEKNI